MAKTRRDTTATARAGNYVAPIDTVGMDPEMKRTLGIGTKPSTPPPDAGLSFDKLLKGVGNAVRSITRPKSKKR